MGASLFVRLISGCRIVVRHGPPSRVAVAAAANMTEQLATCASAPRDGQSANATAPHARAPPRAERHRRAAGGGRHQRLRAA